jgi:hypothetical protein
MRAFASGQLITLAAGAVPPPRTFTWVSVTNGINNVGGSLPLAISNGTTSGLYLDSNPGVNLSGSVWTTTSISLPFSGPCLLAATRVYGAAARMHYINYSTGAWQHVSLPSGGTSGTTTTPTAVTLGAAPGGSNRLNGGLAAAAAYDYAMTDEQVETLAYSLNNWINLTPAAMWVLDQSDVSQAVIDWTGNGANQTAITGTTVSATSFPTLGYGHPVLVATREGGGVSGTAAGTLPALGAQVRGTTGNTAPPVVTGTPQAFGFTTSGTVVTYTGGGTTGSVTYDVLCINSDNTVSVPEFGSPAVTRVGSQGSYIFTRQGGTSTATINLGGGVNTNTSVLWLRVTNTAGLDTSTTAGIDSVSGSTTPALTSSTLAATTDLALAFAAAHSFGSTMPAGLTWSTGYTQQTEGGIGTTSTSVYGSVAVKTPAGTAAETPSASWSNGSAPSDRYLLFAAFLGAPVGGETGTVSATMPALQSAMAGTATATGSATTTLPALQTSVGGSAGIAGNLAASLPALAASVTGTASASGTAAATLPKLTSAITGTAGAAGTASTVLPALNVTATGTASANGTVSATLPVLQAAAVGNVAGVASGGITATLPALTGTVSGTVSATGTVSAALPALTGQAAGVVTAAGSAGIVLPKLTAAAAGTASSVGAASIGLPALQAAVVGGLSTVAATATIGLPALVAVANGTASGGGQIAGILPSLTVTIGDEPVYVRRPGTFAAGTTRSRLVAGTTRGPTYATGGTP